MIQTAVTTQPAKPTPFRPSNFYEVPLGASRQPPSVVALEAVAAPCPTIPLTTAVTSKVKSQPQRRTLRTVMLDAAGKLQGAKIDLTTGEVIQKQYKDYFEHRPKAKYDPNSFDLDPFWMRMEAAERSTGLARQNDKSRCKRFNVVKMYLQGYASLDEASGDLPILRDIIASALLLDLGTNTRALSQGRLFWMLQHIDIITPETVMEFMECGLRHAQKVAGCLRVIINAFEAASDGKLSTVKKLTPPKKSRAEARQAVAKVVQSSAGRPEA